MVTLADIAQETGFNISTVSRALNNSASISEDTRKRICSAAKQLGYSHRRGRLSESDLPLADQMAGIIVPEVLSGYYAALVHYARDRFAQKGFSTLLALSNFDTNLLLLSLAKCAQAEVKCILAVVDAFERLDDSVFDLVRKLDIPIIFVTAKYISSMDFDSIYIDERRGIIMAIEYLLSRGYERIGYIGDQYTDGRYRVFREVMRDHGKEVNPTFISVGNDRAELGGYLRMKEMLAFSERPDAVFASYDQMAFGAMHAIGEANLRIPEDIGLIGFDDVIAAQYVGNGLTTVAHSYEDMMAIAVRILLQRVKTPHMTSQQIALKPELIIRKTTR